MSWPKGNQFWILTGRTDAEAEAPILWLPDEKNWLIVKDPDAGKDWRHEEKESTEDETIGWHHRLYAHELEQVPGVGDGQGSLACCSPWGHKESDMTEWLNWTELKSFPRSRYSQGFKERPQGPENLKDPSTPSRRSWDGMSIEQLCWFKINILPIAQFCRRLVGVCVCVCVYALGKYLEKSGWVTCVGDRGIQWREILQPSLQVHLPSEYIYFHHNGLEEILA